MGERLCPNCKGNKTIVVKVKAKPGITKDSTLPEEDKTVPCPVCSGLGKVTKNGMIAK